MRDQVNFRSSLLRADEAVCSSTKTNSFFELEQHHLVCGAMVAIAPFFLLPHPLLQLRRRVARLSVSDKAKLPRRGVSSVIAQMSAADFFFLSKP